MEDKTTISPVLKSLQEDFEIIGSYVQAISTEVIMDETSEYPIYVAFRDGDSSLGKPFFRKEEHKLNWNYNASILEEFVQKKVVLRDKVEEFMNLYGDPMERACVLILLEEEGGFLFVPFK